MYHYCKVNPLILWHKGTSTAYIEKKWKQKHYSRWMLYSAQYSQHSGDGTLSVALGEFHLTQAQLNECAKDTLRGVLTSLLSEEACLCSSAPADVFVENIIFQSVQALH